MLIACINVLRCLATSVPSSDFDALEEPACRSPSPVPPQIMPDHDDTHLSESVGSANFKKGVKLRDGPGGGSGGFRLEDLLASWRHSSSVGEPRSSEHFDDRGIDQDLHSSEL